MSKIKRKVYQFSRKSNHGKIHLLCLYAKCDSEKITILDKLWSKNMGITSIHCTQYCDHEQLDENAISHLNSQIDKCHLSVFLLSENTFDHEHILYTIRKSATENKPILCINIHSIPNELGELDNICPIYGIRVGTNDIGQPIFLRHLLIKDWIKDKGEENMLSWCQQAMA